MRGPAVCSGCSQPIPAGVGHACTGSGVEAKSWWDCNAPSFADVPAPPPSDLRWEAIDRLRQRRLEKREEYADYERHHVMRVREADLHGMWDCAVNMAEVSNYLDALDFALKALGEK